MTEDHSNDHSNGDRPACEELNTEEGTTMKHSHTTVLITGPGKGVCLECHQEVVTATKEVLDRNFIPAIKVPQQYWVTDILKIQP